LGQLAAIGFGGVGGIGGETDSGQIQLGPMGGDGRLLVRSRSRFKLGCIPCWLRTILDRFQRLSRPRDDCRSVLLGWDVITVEQCQVRQGGNAADYFVNRPAMLSECGAPVSGGSGELVRLKRAWGCVQRALLLTIDDKKTSFRRKTAYEPGIEEVKNRPCLSRGLRYHENSCRGRIGSTPVAPTNLIKGCRSRSDGHWP
jgi:hypothetical protein